MHHRAFEGEASTSLCSAIAFCSPVDCIPGDGYSSPPLSFFDHLALTPKRIISVVCSMPPTTATSTKKDNNKKNHSSRKTISLFPCHVPKQIRDQNSRRAWSEELVATVPIIVHCPSWPVWSMTLLLSLLLPFFPFNSFHSDNCSLSYLWVCR